jgi:hypothetical protein
MGTDNCRIIAELSKEVSYMNDRIFDYNTAAINANMPQDVLARLIEEARQEFPFDQMMTELHVIRAINVYSTNMAKVVGN